MGLSGHNGSACSTLKLCGAAFDRGGPSLANESGPGKEDRTTGLTPNRGSVILSPCFEEACSWRDRWKASEVGRA